jgi:hypothetical protein
MKVDIASLSPGTMTKDQNTTSILLLTGEFCYKRFIVNKHKPTGEYIP